MKKMQARFRTSTCWPCPILIFLIYALAAASASATGFRAPEPDPPAISGPPPGAPGTGPPRPDAALAAAPAVEWTYHKTDDHLHPDGDEQQLLWLMNRARANPSREGAFLAALNDSAVAAARGFFNVDCGLMQAEFAGYAAKPPAAFDVRLYAAAKAHSEYLIGIDGQNHVDQFARIQSAGFRYGQAAGIVYSYSKHALYGHAGFNIDWGPGTGGTQDPPGHRYAIMSVNAGYSNVGYAVVAETNPNTAVGPQVITGNMCSADTRYADHYNRFLVGTVWSDANGNDRYDPGEGVSGVRVQPGQGGYYAVTAAAGGYALPLTAEGAFSVTFSGGTLITPVARTVSVGADSVLLDLEYTRVAAAPEPCRIGVFRPRTGYWHIDANGDGVLNDCSVDGCYLFGKKKDLPLAGDWNGDGLTELGVYRPKKRTVFLDRDADNAMGGAKADPRIKFGSEPGDLPVAGDWNGDGVDEIGFFRPADGQWLLDLNGNGRFDGCDRDGCFTFGKSADRPVVGDWDGDGVSEIGVFRPATGEWFLDLNGNGALDDCATDVCAVFGGSGDLPVPGDWDGDGVSDLGVFRPATAEWFLDLDGDRQWGGCGTDGCHRFGTGEDLPVAVRW
jgi:hypothetical protein